MSAAISREKQLKAWRQAWKVALIEEGNPFWEDRAIGLGFEAVAAAFGIAAAGGKAVMLNLIREL